MEVRFSAVSRGLKSLETAQCYERNPEGKSQGQRLCQKQGGLGWADGDMEASKTSDSKQRASEGQKNILERLVGVKTLFHLQS